MRWKCKHDTKENKGIWWGAKLLIWPPFSMKPFHAKFVFTHARMWAYVFFFVLRFFGFHNYYCWEHELTFPPLCPLFVFFWFFCLQLLGALYHSSIQSVEKRVWQENTSAKVAEWLQKFAKCVCKMHEVWVWRRVVWQRQRIALAYFRWGLNLGLQKWCSSLVLLMGKWIVMKKSKNLDFH
jgi:hypothetical protein